MSRIKDMITSDPVHERLLEVKTYPLAEGKVVVEGWLRDERLIAGFHWQGQELSPGVVHHMCVRLLLAGFPLEIIQAEAEMPGVPHPQCPEIKETISGLKGLAIKPGFTDAVRRRLGGIKGCAHLTHLVTVMGPAALHGFWTHNTRRPHPAPRRREDFKGLNYLVDSCHLWRQEGPLLGEIQEWLDRLREDEN